eukprot:gene19607-6794_t
MVSKLLSTSTICPMSMQSVPICANVLCQSVSMSHYLHMAKISLRLTLMLKKTKTQASWNFGTLIF